MAVNRKWKIRGAVGTNTAAAYRRSTRGRASFNGRRVRTSKRHDFGDIFHVRANGLDIGYEVAGGGPLDVHIMAMAASPGRLVIAFARRLPPGEDEQASLVNVRRDGGRPIRIDDPPLGLIDAIDVSPSGAWLSIEYALSGRVRMIPTTTANRPAAIPETTNGLAWSPNGRFVAVALSGELRIVDLVTGASTSLPEVRPTSLAWTQ
jgi:hypothetical protein